MITITIDSNIINTRKENENINQLEKWFDQGKINIVASERFFQEMKGNITNEKKAKSYKNISEPNVIGVGVIGSSKIARKIEFKVEEIMLVLFPNIKTIELLNPNQLNDVMQLMSHLSNNNDYFVTNDKKDFIHSKKGVEDYQKQILLRERVSINVLTPEQCVVKITKILKVQ